MCVCVYVWAVVSAVANVDRLIQLLIDACCTQLIRGFTD